MTYQITTPKPNQAVDYFAVGQPDNNRFLRRAKRKSAADTWDDKAKAAGFTYCGNGNYSLEIDYQSYLIYTGSFPGRRVKVGGTPIADIEFTMTDDPERIKAALVALEGVAV